MVLGTNIERGCLDGPVVKVCEMAPNSTCEYCSEPRCNSKSYEIFCHRCTPFNPMCAYKQQDTLALPCNLQLATLNDRNWCYTEIK